MRNRLLLAKALSVGLHRESSSYEEIFLRAPSSAELWLKKKEGEKKEKKIKPPMKNANGDTMSHYHHWGKKKGVGNERQKSSQSHSFFSHDAWRDVYRELRGDREALKFKSPEKTTPINLVFNSSSSICISAINLDSGSALTGLERTLGWCQQRCDE